jgi:hypothetical protein
MKKFIFTLCAISAMCGLQASNGQTYHVDSHGSVTVGAQKKISSNDFDITCKSFANRKPEKAEITGVDPRQSKDNSGSWFSW